MKKITTTPKIQGQAASPTPRETARVFPSNGRLLIVDDETAILQLLKDIFSPLYFVETAESGDEALQILHKGFNPHVIISDQRMPGMTGAEFLAQSRLIVPNSIRVTLTGYSDVSDIIQSVNSGYIYRFITKPWNAQELIEGIRLCFEQYETANHVKELEELNREKTELMNILAHNLKNPLSAIIGLSDILQTSIPNPESPKSQLEEMSKVIYFSSERMLEIVTQLLNVNTIENGEMRLEAKILDISSIVKLAIEMYVPAATAKQQTIHFECDELSLEAIFDETSLIQVLDNLLTNAIKYSPLGKNIWVRVKRMPNSINLEVQDEGPGLTEDDKTKLFGKFSRLSAQPTGEGEHSTGLGLSITKKLIELNHGNIWCKSEVGKGATFIVELPTSASVEAN